jgi:predicted nucleotidyltransferase
MTTKDNVLAILKFHKPELSRYVVSVIGLFGSYVRKEQLNRRDVGLLIDFEQDKESFDNLWRYVIYSRIFLRMKRLKS